MYKHFLYGFISNDISKWEFQHLTTAKVWLETSIIEHRKRFFGKQFQNTLFFIFDELNGNTWHTDYWVLTHTQDLEQKWKSHNDY